MPVLVARDQEPIPVVRVNADPPLPVPLPVVVDPNQAPIPVTNVNDGPIDVNVISAAANPPPAPAPRDAKAHTVTKGEGHTLQPSTTEEQDRVTKGQREISRIWEISQACIAILVTGSTVFVLAYISIMLGDVSANQLVAAMQLNVMATLILTFYFARTNHQKIGGVGRKANESDTYEGR